jgi:hypothetical protein
MPFLNPSHRGLAYGDGHIQGDGAAGHLVRIVGNDLFAVNTDPTKKSFGILVKDYKGGEMCTVYCDGGTYETDVYDGTITAGQDLKVSANGRLASGAGAVDEVVARAISVSGGTLKFRLLI